MLRSIRKFATGHVLKVVLFLIAVVFVLWGVGSISDKEKVVAEVGPHKITLDEYRSNYNRTYNYFRNLSRGQFDDAKAQEMKLREKVMDELVNHYLLLLKAGEMGIVVTQKEFDEYIGNIEAFKVDGTFSPKRYLEALKRQGEDPKRFEEKTKGDLVVQKMVSIIGDIGTPFSETDLWDHYVRERGKVALGYAVFDPAEFKQKVTVSEKEISERYEREKNLYRSENRYRLRMIVVEPKAGLKDDTIYMDLLKEKDFVQYGKQKGLEVTDLGLIQEGDLKRRFGSIKVGDALKDLKKGEITLPVRDGLKSYIFQLVDKEEGKLMEKASVIGELGEKMRAEKARAMAASEAQAAIDKKSVDTKKDTGFVERKASSIEGIGQIPQEHLALFGLNEKDRIYGKPVEIGGKYYVFTYKNQQEPDKGQWEKEKAVFRQVLIAKSREDFTRSILDNAKKKQKVKIMWEDV